MKNIVIDIETRIRKDLIKEVIFEGQDISEEDAYEQFKATLRDQSNGRSDFMPIIFHEPISIGYSICTNYKIDRIGMLPRGDEGIQKFWAAVNSGNRIITWGGRAFDMPVLELAAVRLGIQSPDYYNTKYGARYRFSDDGHMDVFEVVTNNGAVTFRGGLNAISKMMGLPGKTGSVRGSEVQQAFEDGRIDEIDRYCLGDVLITYAVWLRVDHVRGRLNYDEYIAYLGDMERRLEELG